MWYNFLKMDTVDITPKMEKVLEILKSELATIRTGRASVALIENLQIPVYGGTQKLKVSELGLLGTIDANTLTIQPFDPSIIGEIRNGIMAANLGLTPIVDNQIIRISIPPPSAERRQEYVKLIHKHLENARIMIRQARQDKMQEIKRSGENGDISEDERFRFEKELQNLTDKFVEMIEEIGEKKEQELLNI